MSTERIEDKVREIIAEQLGLSDEDVQLDASFSGELGADDLDIVELIMAFEEEFDLDIDDDDGERLKTGADVVDYITSRVH